MQPASDQAHTLSIMQPGVGDEVSQHHNHTVYKCNWAARRAGLLAPLGGRSGGLPAGAVGGIRVLPPALPAAQQPPRRRAVGRRAGRRTGCGPRFRVQWAGRPPRLS